MMDDFELIGVFFFFVNYKLVKFIVVFLGFRILEVLIFDFIVNFFVYGF